MTRTRRIAYAVLGTLCVALGALGVVVPGLPTAVFLLAASWFYTRSSPVLERWLRQTPWLGEVLRRFEESRAMSPRTKALAITSMWGGIGLGVVFTSHLHVAVPLSLVILGLIGTVVILFRVPTEPTLATSRAGTHDR